MQIQPNSAAPQVTGALRNAARSTGTSFDYLLATAQIESNLNPSAQASTSSAQGLFQFIDQTWLGTMKRAGPGLGLGQYSSAIVQGADGRFEIPDPAARDAIMKMRTNPQVSAMMAGAYARNNAAQLAEGLGRPPTEGELYIAHFLGSDGANRLIGAALTQPKAADLFPQAASANRSIFTDRAGKPRGALDVYRVLTGRYEGARASAPPQAQAQVAAAPPITGALRGTLPATAPVQQVAAAQAIAVRAARTVAMAPATAAPDTAGLTSAYADANADAPPAADTKPLFQAMFTSRPRQGVAPVVSQLWSPAPAADDKTTRTLDLFTDSKADSRKLFGGGV